MADYYPLIARAIAAAKDSPAETRAQVYERARQALMKHLRNATPALSPEAIEREDAALDEAIARVEAEILSGDQPGQETDPAPIRSESEPNSESEPVRDAPRRPLAPTASGDEADPGQATRKRWRLMAVGGLVAAMAVSVAVFALSRREDPARYSPQPPTAEAPSDPNPKLGERVSGDPSDPARRPDATAPSAQPAAAPRAPAANQPPVAVAQRAILYEQRPETPNEPIVVNGRAIWRLENTPTDQGEEPVVKAELEFPERSMTVDMTIRRNRDAALPASHLIEIKFQFRAGGGPIKDLASPPTMKQEENQRGSPLIGLQVPVMENFFLVGLSNASHDVERNISQLQTANWIDLPFRFADDRIGVIAIEKGVQGSEALQAAIGRWRN